MGTLADDEIILTGKLERGRIVAFCNREKPKKHSTVHSILVTCVERRLKVEVHRSIVSTDDLHTKSITEQQSSRILTNYLILSTVSKYDLVTANLANAKTHNTTNNIHYQLMPGGLTCLVFSNGVTNTGKITHHDHFLKNNHTSPHWSFNVMKFPDCYNYGE